jgi:predicted RNA-binding Zn ribbon-like protein
VAFELLRDSVALDFAATVAERGTTDEEQLNDAGDLSAWIAAAGIVDRPPAVTRAQLAHAKQLRESVFAVVSAVADHQSPATADVAVVNEVAGWRGPRISLTPDGRAQRSGGFRAAMAAIAADCIALCGSEEARHLRWCSDARCTRLFVDQSRGHRRRWCGMRGCGDRAKAAAYRARRRTRAAAAS